MLSRALLERVKMEVESIASVANKSKNLKGNFVKRLKDSMGSIVKVAEEMCLHSQSEEADILRRKNDHLEKEVEDLRRQMATMREEVESIKREERAQY